MSLGTGDAGKPASSSSDGLDILFNFVFALTLGSLLFLAFCFLRQRFTGLYSSNIYPGHKRSRKLAPVRNGFFSWIGSLATLPDGLLLPLAGFDGYSVVQSLRLTFGLLLFMAVPALGVLVPFYYACSDPPSFKDVQYLTFSITSVYGKSVWVPTLISWLIALVTFYVIFVFYRNFATLRQIYLTNPSCLMSFAHLRRTVDAFGSLQDARAYFNVSTRTVMIHAVSAEYGLTEVRALLEKAGLGPVEKIKQIKSSGKVDAVMQQRSHALQRLEQALQALYLDLLQEWQKKAVSSGSFESKEVSLKYLGLTTRLTVQERSELMKTLLTDPAMHPEQRDSVEVTAPGSEGDSIRVDRLCWLYERVLTQEAEIKAALRDFNSFQEVDLIRNEASMGGGTGGGIGDSGENEDFLPHPQEGYLDKTSLISLQKVFQVSANLSDVRNTLWGSSYSVIVTFKSKQSASLCRQLLLSARLFSLQIQPIPLADDLIWGNAAMPNADRAQRQIFSRVLYITFNMFFVFITTGLAYLTNLQTLEDNFSWIKPILESLGPKIRAVIQGILAPLAFNMSILVAPYVLWGMLRMTGSPSQSEIQSSLMSNYAWFLFFQTSIIGAIFSTVFEIIITWQQNNLDGIFEKIRQRMPHNSHFFANIILQKAFIGLMIVLIQPGVLMKKAAFSLLLPLRYRTVRMRQQFRGPSDIAPGIIFPEFIVFPYQITMAFLTVTPLSILPGLMFYAVALFVFKHQFVYTYAVPNESGGGYWRKLSVHLIAGVLMNQIFAVLQFRQQRDTILPTMAMILLITITSAYIPFLERTFGPTCSHIPLTEEDRLKKRLITGDLVHKQAHLLQVLQPIETAPLVFARLDSEGDLIEGFEDGESSGDLEDSEEVLSFASFPQDTNKNMPQPQTNASTNTNSASTYASLTPPISVPIIHHSSVKELRSYEVIPLKLLASQASQATFDPYDLDNLTDRRCIRQPYSHPCLLEHTQVIMVPAKLPILLKLLKQLESGEAIIHDLNTHPSTSAASESRGSTLSLSSLSHQSPIAMGESAVTEPPGSPQDNPYI